MKTIIVFLFMLASPILAIDWNYTLERIDVDFNGVTNSNKTVVAYGTGSIILYSTDLGTTWSQKLIHNDSLDIKQLIFRNDRYIGILNKHYIVVGTSDAKNWQSYYTGYEKQASIEADNENIYVLSEDKIYIYDADDISLQRTIIIADTNNFYELKLFRNRLVAAGDKGKLLVIDLQDSYRQDIIDFEQLGFCLNCGRIIRVIVDADNLNININGKVYSSENLDDWNIFVSDISYLYDKHNGSIYDILTGITSKKIPYIIFKKHNKNNKTKISIDDSSQNVGILRFTDYEYVTDNILVAVGLDKLIAISIDKGVHWKIISYFKNFNIQWINDTTCLSIQYKKGRVYRTTDAGITWKPSKIIDEKIFDIKNPIFLFEDTNGNVFFYNNPTHNAEPNIMYSTNNCKSFLTKKIDEIYDGHIISVVPNQNEYILNIASHFRTWPFTVLHVMDSMMNFKSRHILDSIQILEVINYQNQLVALAFDKHWPYNLSVNQSLTNDSNYYAFLVSNDNGFSWKKLFNLDMKDTLLRSLIIYNDNILVSGAHYFETNKNDSLWNVLDCIYQLYQIDINAKNIKRIFNNKTSMFQTCIYNKTLLTSGKEYILENSSHSMDSNSWRKISVPKVFIRAFISYNDNLWCNVQKAGDPQTPIHLMKIRFKNISYVLEKVDTKTKLYTFPPYPNPARNIVRTKIYWDLRYDIEKSDISVYDYTGNKVAGREEININRLNNYSGMLTWDCSKYNAGLYFIVIKHGDSTRSIPVIVEK